MANKHQREMKKQKWDIEPGEWYEMPQGDLVYLWCCDCNLRHVVEFRIVKNKKGKLEIQRRSWRDDFATELRRDYEKKVGKI